MPQSVRVVFQLSSSVCMATESGVPALVISLARAATIKARAALVQSEIARTPAPHAAARRPITVALKHFATRSDGAKRAVHKQAHALGRARESSARLVVTLDVLSSMDAKGFPI